MSLAPAERRALARIEESLCRSDPRLASMLTRFSLPVWRGGWAGLTRRHRRLGSFLPVVMAVAMVLLPALVIGLSVAAPLSCGPRGGAASAAATAHVRGCPPAIPRGHTGTTQSAGNQDAP
jgi:hypothetical protein